MYKMISYTIQLNFVDNSVNTQVNLRIERVFELVQTMRYMCQFYAESNVKFQQSNKLSGRHAE